MAETIVIGCQPIEVPEVPDDVQTVDWADVPHPPTDEDGPVMVIHVLKYHDAAVGNITPDDMAAYQRAAGDVAVPHGVRISGWFAAEGTILGDGRTWDQVRFNLFPSKAAFMAVVMDPARLEAQKASREPAIADTYTMIVRPTIDRIADSLTASPRRSMSFGGHRVRANSSDVAESARWVELDTSRSCERSTPAIVG